MTDERLSNLERRFRASSSLEDEAAWLRARVQAGELEQGKLELAAYLGHSAAVAALGEPPTVDSDPSIFAATLTTWGRDTAIRSLLATATYTGERYSLDRPARRRAIGVVLCSLDAWVGCPCRRHLREVKQSVTNSTCLRQDTNDVEPYFGLIEDEVATFVLRLAEVVVDGKKDPRGALITMAVRLGVTAVRDDLVPWALGYSDPVRERVEARQREAAGE